MPNSGPRSALNGGPSNEDETPRPSEHHHRRAPKPDGVELSSRGVTIGWQKILAAVFALVGVAAPSVAAGTLLAPKPRAEEAPTASNKLDRLLSLTERLEKKLDRLDERQRSVELDVAALKARADSGERGNR